MIYLPILLCPLITLVAEKLYPSIKWEKILPLVIGTFTAGVTVWSELFAS